MLGILPADVKIEVGRTREEYTQCHLQSISTTVTADCLYKMSMVGRYVHIRPVPLYYLSLCEVIVRGHVFNRNMTLINGNYHTLVFIMYLR